MIDLVAGIEQSLMSLDAKEAEDWRVTANSRNYSHYPPMAQLQLVNNYWHLKLAESEHDTMMARSALRHDLNPTDWMTIFNRCVAPVVVRCSIYNRGTLNGA